MAKDKVVTVNKCVFNRTSEHFPTLTKLSIYRSRKPYKGMYLAYTLHA